MNYAPIDLVQNSGRLLPMLATHTTEVFGDSSNLDLFYLSKLVELQLIKAYGAYENEQLIGYAIFIISRDIFRASVKQAECVALYIQPAYRNYIRAKHLLLYSEKMLEAQECINEITIVNNLNNSLTKFYKRQGFKETSTLMRKEIKTWP